MKKKSDTGIKTTGKTTGTKAAKSKTTEERVRNRIDVAVERATNATWAYTRIHKDSLDSGKHCKVVEAGYRSLVVFSDKAIQDLVSERDSANSARLVKEEECRVLRKEMKELRKDASEMQSRIDLLCDEKQQLRDEKQQLLDASKAVVAAGKKSAGKKSTGKISAGKKSEGCPA